MDDATSQSRVKPVDPQYATGKIKRLFGQMRVKFGFWPSLLRVLANAPVALEGYVNFSAALARGTLNAKVREQVALTVAESNLCAYCLSAHTAAATKIGLNKSEINAAICASATDPRTDAILKLARSIVVQRAELADADLACARTAGLTDGEVVETVANVALNIFESYMSHVARISIDFPQRETGATSSQGDKSNGEH